jgi:hypothetical protein
VCDRWWRSDHCVHTRQRAFCDHSCLKKGKRRVHIWVWRYKQVDVAVLHVTLNSLVLIFYLAPISTLSTGWLLRQKLAMNNEESLDRMCCGDSRQPLEEPSLSQEFNQAVAHQTFGIDEYNITERGGTSVKATLKLSDGRICAVELSKQGYEVLHFGCIVQHHLDKGSRCCL